MQHINEVVFGINDDFLSDSSKGEEKNIKFTPQSLII